MIAVYPGSFDPPTNGHFDIILRASKFSDKLIVAVLNNGSKTPFLTVDQRIKLLHEITKDLPNVQIMSFSGLLVDFAKAHNVKTIIRGLRAVSDFEYEFQMALTNRSIDGDLETLFISTSIQYLYLSSSIVKEVFKLGGPIDDMVPLKVKEFLENGGVV